MECKSFLILNTLQTVRELIDTLWNVNETLIEIKVDFETEN